MKSEAIADLERLNDRWANDPSMGLHELTDVMDHLPDLIAAVKDRDLLRLGVIANPETDPEMAFDDALGWMHKNSLAVINELSGDLCVAVEERDKLAKECDRLQAKITEDGKLVAQMKIERDASLKRLAENEGEINKLWEEQDEAVHQYDQLKHDLKNAEYAAKLAGEASKNLEEKCAEMREVLKWFKCETCHGSEQFTPECQGCLTGEGKCTCQNEPPEPCPQCQAIPEIKKYYDLKKHALSTDCGKGWVSPAKAQMLVKSLELTTELIAQAATAFESFAGKIYEEAKQALAAVREDSHA